MEMLLYNRIFYFFTVILNEDNAQRNDRKEESIGYEKVINEHNKSYEAMCEYI